MYDTHDQTLLLTELFWSQTLLYIPLLSYIYLLQAHDILG